MKCEVRTTDNFERAAKPLLKKYKSLKKELQEIYLLTIYDKSKMDSISQQEINRLIEERDK